MLLGFGNMFNQEVVGFQIQVFMCFRFIAYTSLPPEPYSNLTKITN